VGNLAHEGCVAKKKSDLVQWGKKNKESPLWQSSKPSNGVMREAEIILVCVRGIVNLLKEWKSLQKRRTRERKEAEE
jgi:hypothetical protein